MTATASPDTTQEWGGTRFHVGPGRERTPTMGEIMRVRRCTLPNCAGGKGAHQINSQPIAYSSTPQIKLRVTLTGLHIYLGRISAPAAGIPRTNGIHRDMAGDYRRYHPPVREPRAAGQNQVVA